MGLAEIADVADIADILRWNLWRVLWQVVVENGGRVQGVTGVSSVV